MSEETMVYVLLITEQENPEILEDIKVFREYEDAVDYAKACAEDEDLSKFSGYGRPGSSMYSFQARTFTRTYTIYHRRLREDSSVFGRLRHPER